MKVGKRNTLKMDSMHLSRDKQMIVPVLVDLLQSRNSFILPTLVRLK